MIFFFFFSPSSAAPWLAQQWQTCPLLHLTPVHFHQIFFWGVGGTHVHQSVFPWTEICTSHTVAPKIAGPDRGQKHILHTLLHQITLNSLAFFQNTFWHWIMSSLQFRRSCVLLLFKIISFESWWPCFSSIQSQIVVTVFLKYSVTNCGDRVFQVFSLKFRWSKPVETGTVVVRCETADGISFRACCSCFPTLKIHVHLPECLNSMRNRMSDIAFCIIRSH